MGYWKEKTCQSIILKKVSMTDYHQLSWKIKIWSEVTVSAGGESELKYHGYQGVLQPVIFGLAALHWQGEMLPAQEPNAFASSLVSSKRFENIFVFLGMFRNIWKTVNEFEHERYERAFAEFISCLKSTPPPMYLNGFVWKCWVYSQWNSNFS